MTKVKMVRIILPAVALLLLVSFRPIESANILFYFGISTYSHRIIAWPLIETLAARGHSVTLLSPYPAKEPNQNVSEYTPKELTELVSVHVSTDADLIQERFEGNQRAIWVNFPMLGRESCANLVSKSKEWINSHHFDLVFVDSTYNDCGFGLAHKWGARTILFKTSTMLPWVYDLTGTPVESSWIPDPSHDFPQEMNYWTRVKNTVLPLYNYFYRSWIYHPQLEEILRKGLDMPDMPSLSELFGNVSLVLMNADYTTDYARSLPPLFVQVPGLVKFGKEVKKMSPEMEKFADASKKGFILVSFGSAVDASKMKPELQRIFLYAMGNSSLNFIWKFDGKEMPDGMPSNVFTIDWMPQQAILKHSNCRGFITHGGLGSIHEALYYSIPIIVMPLFAEQNFNAERVARIGHGILLEITTLTLDQLQTAIRRLTEEPIFKIRTKELSVSLTDRQNNPLETAIWWTEKVLRSSEFDLSLLRPLGRNQTWFVRRSLDVFLGIFLALLSPLVLIYVILSCRNSTKQKSTKTQKSSSAKVKVKRN